jgi:octaprenyl-diphosphate synthase
VVSEKIKFQNRLFYSVVRNDLEELEASIRRAKTEDFKTSEHLNSSGKRLRPSVFFLSVKLSEFLTQKPIRNWRKCILIATAIELLHEASLIHDDIVDRSEMRRGNPSVNATVGDSFAILLGDFLAARSSTSLFEAAESFDDLMMASRFIDLGLEIIRGEISQLEKVLSPLEDRERVSFKTYLDVVSAKTALFFAGCAEAGALLVRMDEPFVKRMYDYGLNLGIAFQIVDDILDVVGDPKTVGKTLHNNLREGTITLPFILTYEDAPDNEILKKVVQGKELSRSDEKTVLKLMTEYNSIEKSFIILKEYIDRAKESINPFSRNIYGLALLDLLDFVYERRF